MSKTSWEVKERYNKKMYSPVTAMLPKEMVAEFKEKCKREGISQTSVVRAAIEEYLNEQ